MLNDALSEKTKGIMLAHTLGNPFDLDSVCSFVNENNLWLIEDNCDALGSKWEKNTQEHSRHVCAKLLSTPSFNYGRRRSN